MVLLSIFLNLSAIHANVSITHYRTTKSNLMNETRIRIMLDRKEPIYFPIDLKKEHPELYDLLRKAYSAEKAAALAYQGHAGSVKNRAEKTAIHQIELDEWSHRHEVLQLMKEYKVPVSKYYEFKYQCIGKTISFGCYVIGWFMPFYFAGKLESGNVCEYFRMKQFFNSMGVHDHDKVLYDMGIKEKEHEVYFLSKIKNNKLLPFFEKIFSWGKKSTNNVDLDKKYPVEESGAYCKK
jgi:rubrerythrin